mmetsp:Transcript_103396/g.211037  ORF Transcript_103396/g.211037 Transcript_103396/m.211037 type:complete len:101 (+) Transcript_103396:929-1231(+)
MFPTRKKPGCMFFAFPSLGASRVSRSRSPVGGPRPSLLQGVCCPMKPKSESGDIYADDFKHHTTSLTREKSRNRDDDDRKQADTFRAKRDKALALSGAHV